MPRLGMPGSRHWKNRRDALERKALRGSGFPMNVEQVQSLRIGENGIQIFHNDAGSIFPVILDLIAQGYSIRRVEEKLKFFPRQLETILRKHPKLADACREVKRNRLDAMSKEEDLTDLV